MQKYLILVNVDLALTGFVPVPECFELGSHARETFEADGWVALVGGLAFIPDEEEIRLGHAVVQSYQSHVRSTTKGSI